jgi:hypothetical protein
MPDMPELKREEKVHRFMPYPVDQLAALAKRMSA